MHSSRFWTVAAMALATTALTAAPQRGQQPAPPSTFPEAKVAPNPTFDKYKADVSLEVDGMREDIQRMNDTVFSFAEPGFQEFETSKYLSDILEKNGFKVERGIAGIPTAFMATWGSGKPVIALGSYIDDIPQASQKPGVSWHEPIIEGAPGHGE
jgi:aminobenzoyl-glutamate utilization protein B